MEETYAIAIFNDREQACAMLFSYLTLAVSFLLCCGEQYNPILQNSIL